MTSTTPTTANRGLLPIGTRLSGFGTIQQVSFTAYRVTFTDGTRSGNEWVSFDQIHGKPEPVMPLVVLPMTRNPDDPFIQRAASARSFYKRLSAEKAGRERAAAERVAAYEAEHGRLPEIARDRRPRR